MTKKLTKINNLDINDLIYLKLNKNKINYININLLKSFLNVYGEILPRRLTGISAIYQRKISRAIKKAKYFKLIPQVFKILN
jgi:small subunit ribosomal protein S18